MFCAMLDYEVEDEEIEAEEEEEVELYEEGRMP